MKQTLLLLTIIGFAFLAAARPAQAQYLDGYSSVYAVAGHPGLLVVCNERSDCHLEHTRGFAKVSIEGTRLPAESRMDRETIIIPPPRPTVRVGMGTDLSVSPLPQVSKIWLSNHPEAWGR